MSTFLELCNRVNGICGIQGTIATVSSPKGIQKIIVEAVRNSWIDIQSMRGDWPWSIGELNSFSTTADQAAYTPTEVFGSASAATDLARYLTKRGIFYEYRALAYVNYEDLPYIDNETAKQPRWYTVNSYNNKLILQKPNDSYQLTIRYVRSVQELTTDNQEPHIDRAFEDAIVYMAVEKVATYIGNAGLFQEYSRKANMRTGELKRAFIPVRYVYPKGFLV